MKRTVITINDSRTVNVPNNVRMTISEIADVFGIYYQTAKRTIRSIEKSGVADGDYSMCVTVEGLRIHPDYYGLEMIIALAFRVKSKNAKILRNWLMNKICHPTIMPFQKLENEYFFSLN